MEMEKDMNVREWMLEKIEMYCDADRRKRADQKELEEHCPTIEEAMLWA